MRMEQKFAVKIQPEKVDALYEEFQQWYSTLCLFHDEILFFDRLINSYVFVPHTPDFFERLENYRNRIWNSKKEIITLKKALKIHKRGIAGMLECDDESCDVLFYQKHEQLKKTIEAYTKKSRNLRNEIFNYAASILKNRKSKPSSQIMHYPLNHLEGRDFLTAP
ncbi:hypothetical protein HPE56_03450 [Maribacter sp. ANRC-HE7]|uniref:Uncharacterized protein n=1 Tax=Maribacter aquimaris TaxID=2737171 RepID=A0ABR7UYY3_9FLAO|nr:hypothetical protein [Maribacter aquimaris]MBD0776839.1 hypothetical protein [Maribacter aquimaris]